MAFNLFKKKGEPKAPKARKVEAETPVEKTEGPSIQIAIGTPILKHFHISEKSTRGFAMNQYTFIVADKATKTDVKHAVQRAFKVDVTDVHIVRLPAKDVRMGRYQGKSGGLKKAIVVLKAGQAIAQAQP
jgi:large subunit ribosomal protein L23